MNLCVGENSCCLGSTRDCHIKFVDSSTLIPFGHLNLFAIVPSRVKSGTVVGLQSHFPPSP